MTARLLPAIAALMLLAATAFGGVFEVVCVAPLAAEFVRAYMDTEGL